MLEKDAKIFVAGHHGLVGSAIWNNLLQRGYTNLTGRSHKELDLLDGVAVKKFFDEEKPDAVVLAAAHVGGIMANLQYRADFIYRNLQIQQNVIGESFRHGVKKLLFLGSTCIYPREAPQPMKEEVLLTSPLEYTNEPYAIAKIAGLKMCESFNLQYGTNYIAVMPTNLYGPNDNFHLENSHVLPAMIRKIYLAKCLNEGNWDAVRKDIDLRPVEGVNGSCTDEEILAKLAKFGITPVGHGQGAARIPLERRNGGCQRTCVAERGLQGYVCRRFERDTQLPHQRGNRKGTQHQGSGGKNHGGNRLQGRTEMGCKQTGRHAAQVDGCNQTAQPGMAS